MTRHLRHFEAIVEDVLQQTPHRIRAGVPYRWDPADVGNAASYGRLSTDARWHLCQRYDLITGQPHC